MASELSILYERMSTALSELVSPSSCVALTLPGLYFLLGWMRIPVLSSISTGPSVVQTVLVRGLDFDSFPIVFY